MLLNLLAKLLLCLPKLTFLTETLFVVLECESEGFLENLAIGLLYAPQCDIIASKEKGLIYKQIRFKPTNKPIIISCNGQQIRVVCAINWCASCQKKGCGQRFCFVFFNFPMECVRKRFVGALLQGDIIAKKRKYADKS